MACRPVLLAEHPLRGRWNREERRRRAAFDITGADRTKAIGEHRETIGAAGFIELFGTELALVNRIARGTRRLQEVNIRVRERRRFQRCAAEAGERADA